MDNVIHMHTHHEQSTVGHLLQQSLPQADTNRVISITSKRERETESTDYYVGGEVN